MMMLGKLWMPVWLADSWDSLDKVSQLQEKFLLKMLIDCVCVGGIKEEKLENNRMCIITTVPNSVPIDWHNIRDCSPLNSSSTP